MVLICKKTGNRIEAGQDFYDAHASEYSIYVKPPETLKELKSKKIKELHRNYQSFYDNYLSKYPKSEISSFEDKKNEALAYMQDSSASTPIIDSIVSGYGGNKEEYINSVVEKVKYLAEAEGKMVAIRDAIKSCGSVEELNSITV